MSADLLELAKDLTRLAKRFGADDSAVSASRTRFVELRQRDGRLERVRGSTSSSIAVGIYCDDRFSSCSTADLRPDALERFVEQAVATTRLLGADPHRKLADPALYEGRSTANLELYDPDAAAVDDDRRRALVDAVDRAAHTVDGPIISVSAGYNDTVSEFVRVHSNGFEDGDRGTQFAMGASVTVAGEGARKPLDWHWVGARYHADLEDPTAVGVEASRRALGRRGQVTLPTAEMTLVVENRCAGAPVGHFMRGMGGGALQQKRSFLLDKLGQRVGSEHFTLVDDPFVRRGFGSRRFDGDGISTRRRVLVDAGTLREYLIGVYYASKLGTAPTGGGTSNLGFELGSRSASEIIGGVERGVYVTGFMGGNSAPTTGDFSHGLQGFEIVDGVLGRPVGEMNVTGSHQRLWHQLAEVGNDPYPYAARRMPTLVFEGLSVSGT